MTPASNQQSHQIKADSDHIEVDLNHSGASFAQFGAELVQLRLILVHADAILKLALHSFRGQIDSFWNFLGSV